MASWVPCRSPLACVLETRVAVTLGRKENSQNAEEYTWFAAAWPATDNVLPRRFTQKRLILLDNGMIAKIAERGSVVANICLSTSVI